MDDRDNVRTCETCHGRYLAPPGAYGWTLEACRSCRAELAHEATLEYEYEVGRFERARLVREQ